MKNETIQKIDWKKIEKYLQQTLPDLDKSLSQKLGFLRGVESIVYLDDYPPRLSIRFETKEKIGERLLKRNQEKISLIIEELSKKYNLEAKAGIFSTEVSSIVGGRKYCKRFYSYKIGEYTLQPFCKKFIVN